MPVSRGGNIYLTREQIKLAIYVLRQGQKAIKGESPLKDLMEELIEKIKRIR